MNKKIFLKLFSLIILMMVHSIGADYYHKDNLNDLKQRCKKYDDTIKNQKMIDEYFYSYINKYNTPPLKIIEVFIKDCKANVNYYPKSKSSIPPLFEAIYKGNLELVKLLVQNGANVNHNTSWRSPLRFTLLTKHKQNKEIFIYLLKHNANPNYQDDSGISIISTISKSSQKYLSNKDGFFYAKELLKYNVTVTKEDIQWAKKNGKVKLYELLKVNYLKINMSEI